MLVPAHIAMNFMKESLPNLACIGSIFFSATLIYLRKTIHTYLPSTDWSRRATSKSERKFQATELEAHTASPSRRLKPPPELTIQNSVSDDELRSPADGRKSWEKMRSRWPQWAEARSHGTGVKAKHQLPSGTS